MKNSAYETVLAARDNNRISTEDLIDKLFDNFIEFHGDRGQHDDPAIIGGIALLDKQPVTVIGTRKGRNTQENIERHFGCVEPEGYRKALRLMHQAEKFNRPVITLINTPGAYPGMDAEYHGQGSAIATCLLEGIKLQTPYLSIIFGEGGSGGALALACGDEVWMLENSIYSVLSPEGYASIMWKDSKRVQEASEELGLTADALKAESIIERVFPDITDQNAAEQLKNALIEKITDLKSQPIDRLMANRSIRFRKY